MRDICPKCGQPGTRRAYCNGAGNAYVRFVHWDPVTATGYKCHVSTMRGR